jgi:hypothetical protein
MLAYADVCCRMQAEAIEDVAASLFGPDEFVLDLVLNRPLIER